MSLQKIPTLAQIGELAVNAEKQTRQARIAQTEFRNAFTKLCEQAVKENNISEEKQEYWHLDEQYREVIEDIKEQTQPLYNKYRSAIAILTGAKRKLNHATRCYISQQVTDDILKSITNGETSCQP